VAKKKKHPRRLLWLRQLLKLLLLLHLLLRLQWKLLPPLLMPLPMLPRQLLTPLQKRPRLLPPSNRIYRLPEKATFEWLFFGALVPS